MWSLQLWVLSNGRIVVREASLRLHRRTAALHPSVEKLLVVVIVVVVVVSKRCRQRTCLRRRRSAAGATRYVFFDLAGLLTKVHFEVKSFKVQTEVKNVVKDLGSMGTWCCSTFRVSISYKYKTKLSREAESGFKKRDGACRIARWCLTNNFVLGTSGHCSKS